MASWIASLKSMGVSLNNLEDLFLFELKDLYGAEKTILQALPEMAKAASHPELKAAFDQHLHQTKKHRERLEQVFRLLGKEPKEEKCEAIEGIVQEGEILMKAKGNADVKDAALIAAAQRVEHYEISGYGTARTYARRLGHEKAANLLQETLSEEAQTDQKLTQIAESSVNVHAAAH